MEYVIVKNLCTQQMEKQCKRVETDTLGTIDSDHYLIIAYITVKPKANKKQHSKQRIKLGTINPTQKIEYNLHLIELASNIMPHTDTNKKKRNPFHVS